MKAKDEVDQADGSPEGLQRDPGLDELERKLRADIEKLRSKVKTGLDNLTASFMCW